MKQRVWYWVIGVVLLGVVGYALSSILSLPPDTVRAQLAALAKANGMKPISPTTLQEFEIMADAPIYDAFSGTKMNEQQWRAFADEADKLGLASHLGGMYSSYTTNKANGSRLIRNMISSDRCGLFVVRSTWSQSEDGTVHATLTFKRKPKSVKDRFTEWYESLTGTPSGAAPMPAVSTSPSSGPSTVPPANVSTP